MRECQNCSGQIPIARKAGAKYCSDKCAVAACGARWYRQNKDKKRAAGARWREENPQKVSEISRRMYLQNKDAVNERTRAWQAANMDKKRASYRKWAAENPDIRAAIAGKRRAREMSAAPPWLADQHLEQIARTYQRARVLSAETGIPHQVDHIIPLVGGNVCGLHVPWNLQTITALENQRKGNSVAP